jgi:peptide-methionine (S)-S-oxide reductase
MSAIFYHSEEQKRLALQTRDREAIRLGLKIHTEILPAATFYPAEAYHQKYYLRQVPELIREYTALFSELDAFVSSTAVSRVNGYVGGNGSLESLMKEIASLGLSPAGSKRLAGIVQEVNRSMHYAAKGSAFCPVPFTL